MLIQSVGGASVPVASYGLGQYVSAQVGYFFAAEGGFGYVFSDPSTELFLDYFGAPDGSGSVLISDFGAGTANTQTLITINGLYTDVLAYVVDYAGGGKTDWFVGSLDEIQRAYDVAKGVGFFAGDPTPTLATSTACGDDGIRTYLRNPIVDQCIDRSGDACRGWPIRRFVL